MNYVEWLRVRNCLRIYAIVLGCLIVLALIIRISISNWMSDEQYTIDRVSREPGTTITHSMVDGVNRTVIENARERTTITIDNKGFFGGKVITITEPATERSRVNQHIGSFSFQESHSAGMQTVTTRTDEPVNFAIFLVIGMVAMLLVATILGAPFAAENKDHLEIALLKPVTRTRYALGTIGVDAAGIAVSGVLTIIAAIVCQAMFEVPQLDFSQTDGWLLLFVVIGPFAWYAAINAVTTSLKRGSGAVVGFAWPAAFVIIGLAGIPIQGTPVGQVVHTIFWGVSRIVPITYMHEFEVRHGVVGDLDLPSRVGILSLLMLVYGALAVLQWRRVEA